MPQFFIVLTTPVAVNAKSVWLFAAVCVLCVAEDTSRFRKYMGGMKRRGSQKGPWLVMTSKKNIRQDVPQEGVMDSRGVDGSRPCVLLRLPGTHLSPHGPSSRFVHI